MMDAVGAIASVVSAVLECGKLICRPIYLHTKNFFLLQSNINALQQKKTTLNEMKDLVLSKLEAANKDGDLPTPQVQEWLREVVKVMSIADPFQLEMEANNGRAFGCFFNCGISRKVHERLMELERLTKADTFPTQVVEINHQAKAVERIPGPFLEDQATASQNLAKIMELLNRDDVRRVGIWGMGGVGKTTLAKNLNNKLESSSSTQPFGKVIWATVSKESNKLERVLTQIAERLNLSVGESSGERMGIRLHERLMREEKFLLILDDVWEHIDLDTLGIPRPEVHPNYKILLTSRSRTVCTQMNVDTEFRVPVLEDEEAWQLFSMRVGEVVNSEVIKPLAQAIVKECCGLPLAIITMGAAMRRKENVALWKDALNEMRRSAPSPVGIEKEVFNSLKWSYDSLKGNNIKSCFLYCCLYPEDFFIEISELVECWVGEGLIDRHPNYEDSINRGIAIIEDLKDACLLEHGAHKEYVKMHDIIRDVAIWIASFEKDGCKSLVKSGIGLTEILDVQFTESLKRVSFMNNKLKRLPADSSEINCSHVSTLFLQGNEQLEEISVDFMLRFQGLKVLNLSGTGITELPRGIGNLSLLRKLDLSRTLKLESIPAQVICKLSSLEVLHMELSSYIWNCKELVKCGSASIDDLGCLEKLRALIIVVHSEAIEVLNPDSNTWIRRLKTFQFFIDEYISNGRDQDRWVTIAQNTPTGPFMEYLLDYATSLLFHQNKELGMVFGRVHPLKNLKKLLIQYSWCFTDRRHGAQLDLFPNLEVLELIRFSCRDEFSISDLIECFGLRFSKLRSLTLKSCSIKYLFTVGNGSLIQTLGNLEEIHLWECDKLVELFQYGVDPFYSAVPKLHTVVVRECPRLKKLPFDIQNALTMKEVRGEKSWWSELECDSPVTKALLNHVFKEIDE